MNWKQTGVMPGDEQVMVNKLKILSLSLSLSLCVTGEAIEPGCPGFAIDFRFNFIVIYFSSNSVSLNLLSIISVY